MAINSLCSLYCFDSTVEFHKKNSFFHFHYCKAFMRIFTAIVANKYVKVWAISISGDDYGCSSHLTSSRSCFPALIHLNLSAIASYLSRKRIDAGPNCSRRWGSLGYVSSSKEGWGCYSYLMMRSRYCCSKGYIAEKNVIDSGIASTFDRPRESSWVDCCAG